MSKVTLKFIDKKGGDVRFKVHSDPELDLSGTEEEIEARLTPAQLLGARVIMEVHRIMDGEAEKEGTEEESSGR
jgi:hypothetical protein